MARKLPPDNARASHRRKVTAQRRVGTNGKCQCGEKRPEALITGSAPMTCASCRRKSKQHKLMDDHHIAGQSNSRLTLGAPVNDHRAVLSEVQRLWPRETLENRYCSPLLAWAARIRGFVDAVAYLMKVLLIGAAETLEFLDTFLKRKLGPNWWKHTKLKTFETEL